jgi:hypothetical protein
MATPSPKKPLLQSAAADSYSKAGDEMKQAEPPLAKPNVSFSKPPKAARVDDKDRKAR